MSTRTVPTFESSIHTSNIWLKDIAKVMGWPDQTKAYRVLRASLHALRDRLTLAEVGDLAAQLPMLIRGLYYEGWQPAHHAPKERKKQEFLDHVAAELHDDPTIDPEEAARAVFRVLESNVSPGEIQDVKKTLPRDIRVLWQ
jgi:uncharacterized protein (DUF2267 family)